MIFTSKADGNWNASGQTTWNEVGAPGDGDTVSISHAVTVTADATVGTGFGFGVTVLSAGTLAINAGIVLTVNGSVDNQGSIVIGDGGDLVINELAFVSPLPTFFLQ